MEVIYTYFTDGKLVNRGFLIGPYCPIYGCGCILMILLLKNYTSNPVVLFIMAVVICSILEYVTSYLMEKLFNARWWDYSNRKFNINGRICLETMVPFGILGCFLMYFLNPFISGIVNEVPDNIIIAISIVLAILFIIDIITSYSIISKIKVSSRKILKDNTEEITKKVRKYISNYSKLGKRLIESFPDLKILKKRKNNTQDLK